MPDELPDVLDVTAYVESLRFPDIKRRRIGGRSTRSSPRWHCGGAATSNQGLLFGAVLLFAIVAYHSSLAGR